MLQQVHQRRVQGNLEVEQAERSTSLDSNHVMCSCSLALTVKAPKVDLFLCIPDVCLQQWSMQCGQPL